MGKSEFFAQLLVDHCSFPFVYSLLLNLSKFGAFTYSMINRFVSITT